LEASLAALWRSHALIADCFCKLCQSSPDASADRQTEFAIRKALGASRARIVFQLFIENLVLSLVAGTLGFGLAFAQTKVMLGNLPQSANLPRLETVRIDFPLLAFVCGICLSRKHVVQFYGAQKLG
jgi:predicted lysophospholipase L1 biosynthesis ABC-type transport system permease subunit